MAEPYRITSSSQFLTGKGVIEIISLVSGGSQASMLNVFDSHINSGTHGRWLYDLAAPAADMKSTDILSIPFKWGVYGSISGTAATASVTIR